MKPALRHPPHDHEPVQVDGEPGVGVGCAGEAFLGEEARLDAAGEVHLLGGAEQRYPPDLP